MAFPSHSSVAIIGAGPYGVSIAAHLQSEGVDFRIFGRPMHRWQWQMPSAMFLKSDAAASSLSDPAGRFTLAQYCAEKRLPYCDRGMPVSRKIFTDYALSFQRRLVPTVEDLMVTGVDTSRRGFELRLANGTTASASNVIVATGLEHTAYVPPELTGLPHELLSHSREHHDLSVFKGMDVTVIGGGQSALETAALLSEEGATVRLVVRKPSLAWNDTPTGARASLFHRLRYPQSGLGQGLELWLCSTAPMLFRHLPSGIRLERVKTVLGPAGAWWLKERVLGRVHVMLDHSVSKAGIKGPRTVLSVAERNGRSVDISADHVIAATGYRFEVERLPFLSRSLKSGLCVEHHRPVLSSAFESSVPGLFFTGLASATCFGPSMRFLYGAHFTARRVARRIVEEQRQSSSRAVVRCAYASKRSGF
jgi:hypothetical protein